MVSDISTCPLCKSEKSKPHFANDDRIIKCEECDVVRLQKKLWATEEQANYYIGAQNYISAMESSEKVSLSRKRAKSLITKVAKLYPNGISRLKWLDVGANYGLLVEELLKVKCNAEGIELNKKLVELAQVRKLPVNFGDITDLKEHNNLKFDIVSAIDVFEHLPEPIRFLQKMNKLIKTNGLLLIEVPNIQSFLAEHHGLQWKYIDREHLYYFSIDSIKQLLLKYNFSVEKTYMTNPFLETMSIKKLLQYYLPGFVPGDRLNRSLKGLMKKDEVRIQEKKNKFKIFRVLIKKILILGIKIMNREDFILVIARKI